jgi:hypothetical protein
LTPRRRARSARCCSKAINRGAISSLRMSSTARSVVVWPVVTGDPEPLLTLDNSIEIEISP